jgi:HD-GYP domain-containing protein (c-di-GMP phosphodiesterase class II)
VQYPGYFGLAGTQIPLGARILSVVDTFDAITHDRPYRAGRPTQVAIDELRREAGRQFDPDVVEAFIVVLADEDWGERNVHTGGGGRAAGRRAGALSRFHQIPGRRARRAGG